jgi:protein-tyrosine-phosphatase
MRVCFTIDTEFSIAGAFADPALHPVGVPMVLCEAGGRSQGLDFLLSCFRRHGMQATFFVETLQRHYFRDDPMRALATRIAQDKHEVQLHVHPCWAVFQHEDWPQRVRLQPRQDDLAGRELESTVALLRQGQATFAEWGLPAPQVFRAGSLQHDENLYRALAAVGIPFSTNIGLGVYNCGLANYQLRAGRHMRHGVLECPVLTFADWPGHAKTVSLSGTSFAEMRGLLDSAHAAGLELVVILSHPFEYVQSYGNGFRVLRRHAVNQSRLERLCDYIAANPDRFQASGMAAAASQPMTAASSANPLLRGRPWHTAARLATQVLYDRYGQLVLAARQLLLGRLERRHGTWRGAVRALLAWGALRGGLLEAYRLRHPERVRRLVFVCLGNICRSAYAQHVASQPGLPAVSIGLSTSTGAASPDAALRAAQRCGADLSEHRATDFRDFEVLPGDLFLTMEVRHAQELQHRLIARTDVQIALLGLWCEPPMPHLHDPYTLSDAYFDRCFARVRQAVHGLHRTLSGSAA